MKSFTRATQLTVTCLMTKGKRSVEQSVNKRLEEI